MRKYLQILLGCLLCFFGKDGIAQQHLSKQWSVSAGLVVNAKGSNATIHYHLNSFDEIRLNYYGIQQTYLLPNNDNGLLLKTSSFSVEFAKACKFQNLKKTTFYFGIGFFWGKEKMESGTLPVNNLFGVSTSQEMEYAPLNWFAFFARINMLIPTGLVRSKTFRMAFGARFYF